ncbi:hypothetical protein K503DRAFT_869383 [Rhizopogon vinicolor AM-OR11-026]|uniref:Uncharacterized protein n=1 Tax=Rhizopogon vinicolor AM-OR11-026 TaxID=1314800 RepID=A0A1B7MM72_9AGAM|nr:hypothetical protein K503DRAFT_869383 [Rhizopogon vinicolor AM-OR11-026]
MPHPNPSHYLVHVAHNVHKYSLKPAIPSIVDTEVSFPLPATKWSFTTLAQALHLGIATTLILEYSFFLLQQDKSLKPAKSLELAAAEYETSGTPAAIQKAVQDFLSQDDGDDEKLCKMMMDITLRNRMSITKVVKK